MADEVNHLKNQLGDEVFSIEKIEQQRRFNEGKKFRRKRRNSKRRFLKIKKDIGTWIAPEMLTLKPLKKTNRCLCSDAINHLQVLFATHKKIHFDFSSTRIMYPDAVIYLLGTICALKKKYPSTEVRCNHTMSERSKEVLFQVGILKILNWHCQIETKREDVIHWRVAQGRLTEGAQYDTILKQYDGTLSPQLANNFYRVILEAMGNAVEHAYEDPLMVNHPYNIKDWWMFSQERDGKLTVVFCDIGVGIPKSLPYKATAIQAIRDLLLGNKSHSHAIRCAIQYSKTKTGLKNRGKGLHQITTLLSNIEDSRIVIRSDKGYYSQQNGQGKPPLITGDSKSSIIGTIISWSIPLPEQSGELR